MDAISTLYKNRAETYQSKDSGHIKSQKPFYTGIGEHQYEIQQQSLKNIAVSDTEWLEGNKDVFF